MRQRDDFGQSARREGDVRAPVRLRRTRGVFILGDRNKTPAASQLRSAYALRNDGGVSACRGRTWHTLNSYQKLSMQADQILAHAHAPFWCTRKGQLCWMNENLHQQLKVFTLRVLICIYSLRVISKVTNLCWLKSQDFALQLMLL